MSLMVALAMVGAPATADAAGRPDCHPYDAQLISAAGRYPVEVRFDRNSLDGAWETKIVAGATSYWEEIVIEGRHASSRTMFGEVPVTATLNGRNADLTFAHGHFIGQLSQDGRLLTGKLTSTDGQVSPMVLRRHAQEPVGPQPYRAEDVSFRSSDGTILSGTLTVPVGVNPSPAVILAVGSQPADRDYVAMGGDPAHKLYAVLADALTRQRIAVLRFDQRGVGRSSGHAADVTEAQIEADLHAGIDYLAQRPEVMPRRIGIIGHSAGGVRAVRLARIDPQLSFAVLLASPAAPGLTFLDAQAERRAAGERLMHISTTDAEFTKRLARAVASAQDAAEARAKGAAVLKQMQSEGYRLNLFSAAMSIEASTTDPYRFLLRYDPAADLVAMAKPVLSLIPMEDGFVDAKRNLTLTQTALAGKATAQICTLPGLDHTLRHRVTDPTISDDDFDETISPSVLAIIPHWINANNAKRPGAH